MKNINRNKANAAKICRYIDELRTPFLKNRSGAKLYPEGEMKKIRFLKRFFGLDNMYDLIVLCHLIENRFRRSGFVSLEEIANKLSMRFEEFVALNSSLDALVRKRLVRASEEGYRSNDKEYAVTQNCMTAIYEFNQELIRPQQDNSFESFINEFQEIAESHEYSGQSILDCIEELTGDYSTLEEIRWLADQKLEKVESYILIEAVRSYILQGNNFDLEDAARHISPSKHWLLRLERELVSGSSDLISKELLEFRPGPFQNVHHMRLTPKSIEGLSNR